MIGCAGLYMFGHQLIGSYVLAWLEYGSLPAGHAPTLHKSSSHARQNKRFLLYQHPLPTKNAPCQPPQPGNYVLAEDAQRMVVALPEPKTAA